MTRDAFPPDLHPACARTVGLSSTAAVAHQLQQLEERGEITREAGRHRSARIGH
ncbi:LexA family protein [Streptomyces olivochromogenes]|uniref:LexA family protein n=1 Tax=Streptomyces olivochromogenes TaxID=1963 RepID=UPI0036A2BADD